MAPNPSRVAVHCYLDRTRKASIVDFCNEQGLTVSALIAALADGLDGADERDTLDLGEMVRAGRKYQTSQLRRGD